MSLKVWKLAKSDVFFAILPRGAWSNKKVRDSHLPFLHSLFFLPRLYETWPFHYHDGRSTRQSTTCIWCQNGFPSSPKVFVNFVFLLSTLSTKGFLLVLLVWVMIRWKPLILIHQVNLYSRISSLSLNSKILLWCQDSPSELCKHIRLLPTRPPGKEIDYWTFQNVVTQLAFLQYFVMLLKIEIPLQMQNI